MVISLLPEQMFGMDTDDVLAYQTPKLALIRDRYVGALYYVLTSLAMCWVLIGQVLWRNEHFLLKDVKGVSRMLINHPTLNQCDPNEADCEADFKSLSALPYCLQHEGGPEVERPAKCIYADKHSLFIDGTVGGQVFIPTSFIVMDESKHCHPSASNGHSCNNEYRKPDKPYYFNETQMQYYANIEDYTIQFTSTYHRDGISGTSLDHPGFYTKCFDKNEDLGTKMTWEERLHKRKEDCKDERRVAVECMAGVECDKGGLKTIEDAKIMKGVKIGKDLKIGEDMSLLDAGEYLHPQISGVSTSSRALRTLRGHRSSLLTTRAEPDEEEKYRPTPDVYASTWGDTFKLGKLMELAGMDLDRHFNMDEFSARMAGTIIEVEATYSNLRRFLSSFGLSQVQYTYRVRERKLPYVSKETLHPDQPEDYPKHRKYMVQHGILLDFKVGGEFGFFSIVYLLIMLTTSMALLATAHKVTDLTSLYLHPRKENYFHIKYDVSGDFSDMWACTTCGYYNHCADLTCKGLPKWESSLDTPYCGCARPEGWSPSHNVQGFAKK